MEASFGIFKRAGKVKVYREKPDGTLELLIELDTGGTARLEFTREEVDEFIAAATGPGSVPKPELA